MTVHDLVKVTHYLLRPGGYPGLCAGSLALSRRCPPGFDAAGGAATGEAGISAQVKRAASSLASFVRACETAAPSRLGSRGDASRIRRVSARPRTVRRHSRPRRESAAGACRRPLVMTGITVTIGCCRASSSAAATLRCLPSLIRLRVVGKRQLEASAVAALERLARRHPDRVGGFLAVVRADLFRRRRRQKEPGVEALRHFLRRDPVRVGHQKIERQHQIVLNAGSARRSPRRRTTACDGKRRFRRPMRRRSTGSIRAAAPAECRSLRTSRESRRCGNSASPRRGRRCRHKARARSMMS